MIQHHKKSFTPFIGPDKNSDKSRMSDWPFKKEPETEPIKGELSNDNEELGSQIKKG